MSANVKNGFSIKIKLPKMFGNNASVGCCCSKRKIADKNKPLGSNNAKF